MNERLTITASDGYQLLVDRWSVPSPKACLLLAHGIQSHSGWFPETCTQLQNAGYEVWFLNRRGSGDSHFERGHARSGRRLIRDCEHVIQTLRENHPAQPLVGMGFCWGAKIIAAAACDQHKLWDACILCYPGLYTYFDPSLRQKLGLFTARHMGARRRPVPIPLQPKDFTENPEGLGFIENDPITLREMTVAVALSGQELNWTFERSKIRVPTLVQFAGRDKICDNRMTERRLKRCVQTLRCESYANSAHVFEFEENREAIVADAINWLEELFPCET